MGAYSFSQNCIYTCRSCNHTAEDGTFLISSVLTCTLCFTSQNLSASERGTRGCVCVCFLFTAFILIFLFPLSGILHLRWLLCVCFPAGQLKLVMERVLEFAVCELSKIVEDSFDDVLLELRKAERESEELMEKLRAVKEENGAGDMKINESQGEMVESPNGTDVVKVEKRPDEEEPGMGQTQNTDGTCSSPTSCFSVFLLLCLSHFSSV